MTITCPNNECDAEINAPSNYNGPIYCPHCGTQVNQSSLAAATPAQLGKLLDVTVGEDIKSMTAEQSTYCSTCDCFHTRAEKCSPVPNTFWKPPSDSPHLRGVVEVDFPEPDSTDPTMGGQGRDSSEVQTGGVWMAGFLAGALVCLILAFGILACIEKFHGTYH